jgi:branched-chain amino acid transport system ATP-binding protein
MVAATSPLCLELNRVSVSFGEHRVLKDFSLAVGEKEIVGIVGPNGAGKTTLFNVIAGQLRPYRGAIRYYREDISGWPPHRRCHAGMGRTFQIARCFPEMTAIENVMMALWFGKAEPLPALECLDEAQNLLRMVGLEPKITTRARELTLSELRRLEVARALGTRPRLLLLDEIAAGLSPQAVKHSVELVESLRNRGLTLLITDHFLNLTVKVSDRLVALDQGDKIAEGSPSEVMAHPDVVSAYLGERQQNGSEEEVEQAR